ncbi:MAG: Crp/Fnr family transcriptional regulator [Nitrospirae bacterium]|nr:MAG: Crp/Fnr family transcriptional regulator [Nitrospirota bacterium]
MTNHVNFFRFYYSITMQENARSRFLETFPVFHDAQEALLKDLFTSSRLQTFPQGMNVYNEGDTCSAIAFLLSGEIRVFKVGEGGREITLYEIHKGETCILNASCILSDLSYPAHASAVQGGEMLLVPAGEFRRMIEKYPEMRDFVFKILSQRLATVMALVEEIAFGKMDERLSDYLRTEAADGRLAITHQKIANDLGTSREVVSRILKDFERRGKIVLSRNLIQLTNI